MPWSSDFRDLVRTILVEERYGDPDVVSLGKSRLSPDSVDAQIDNQLALYEKRSSSSSAESVEESVGLSLKLILEADEPAEGDEAAPAGDESPEHDDVDGDAGAGEQAAEITKPDLDMNSFALAVARLVENYDKLLDVQSVIITRAKKYVEENYDTAVAGDLIVVLERDHGVSLDPRDDRPEIPPAAGAGPG
jgi:hypothetical protein